MRTELGRHRWLMRFTDAASVHTFPAIDPEPPGSMLTCVQPTSSVKSRGRHTSMRPTGRQIMQHTTDKVQARFGSPRDLAAFVPSSAHTGYSLRSRLHFSIFLKLSLTQSFACSVLSCKLRCAPCFKSTASPSVWEVPLSSQGHPPHPC